MGIIRMKEIRKLTPEQMDTRLKEYRAQLSEKYAQLSAGGSIDDTGKITELRKTIARILTVKNEKTE